ncbi:MAG: hypothetical protein KUG63_09310 [Cycloclasticus sp.]|jgi:hyperosmotically inducible protein|uniref:hypothetical protein n=1 Tax=Cycloclasticus sp. TaxID=2024830 RepID=UPI002580011B|nr:hypothetical protein [Cycloclasticus sp.]MBV1899549.1 hypothetical protein [Cycloclasticus sp.]|tara:strand:+ start:479 stop:703 length:225 start_codon:yes stop_codon:yes gene_type:complete
MKLLHMFTIIITLAFAVIVSGCEPDGPAEKAGEKIDNITQDGPAENAGEKIDEMTEDAAESIEKAGDKLEDKVN